MSEFIAMTTGRVLHLLDLGGRWTVFLAAIAILYSTIPVAWRALHGAPREPIPSHPLALDGAATLGAATAKVVMVEFSDFQCPFCGAFASDTLPELRREFIDTGMLRLAFRHFPLEQIHPAARSAADAAACANLQGRFWAVHDKFFHERLGSLSDPVAMALSAAPIDRINFEACVSDLGRKITSSDMKMGADLSIHTTPTFFVGMSLPNGKVTVTERISGLRPLSQFQTAIRTALSRAKPPA